MSNTANTGMEYLVEGQASPEVSVNDFLNIIDVLMTGRVINRTTATPPGSPSSADMYLVAASPTGAWTGNAGKLAFYYGGWLFITPTAGMHIFDVATSLFLMYDGSSWTSVTAQDTVQTFAYAASITPVATKGTVNVGQLTGNITINAPSGTPTDGTVMTYVFSIDGTGGRTISWNAVFAFGSDVTGGMIPSAANAKFEIMFKYNSADSKWRCLAIARGF